MSGTPNRSGPDVVVTDKNGNVWVGDGFPDKKNATTSSLKGIDPNTNSELANLPLPNSTGRADELAYGNVGGGRIFIANPNESGSAFVTLVDVSDPKNPKNPGGEIDRFDLNPFTISAVFPLSGTCGGTGLAVGPRNDLIVECGDSARIVDTNGHVEATFSNLGGADEIWFNPGDGNAHFPLGAVTSGNNAHPAGVGVLDAVHDTSFGVTAVVGAQGLHSIAVDAHNGRVFLPISDNPDNGAGGIAMLSTSGKRGGGDH